MNVWKMAIVAAASALALAACGSSTSDNGGGGSSCNPTGGSTSGSGTATVKIVSDPNTVGKFDPATVSVTAGQTVEWDFADTSGTPHTVTADDGSFDSHFGVGGPRNIQFMAKISW